MERNQWFWVILFFAILIPIAIFSHISVVESHQNTIREWVGTNNYRVVSIKQPWFDSGPYWFVDEDDTIYRVVVKDKLEHEKVAYFRFRSWGGHDVEWHK